MRFIPVVDKRVERWQVKLCDPSLTCVIRDRLENRDEFMIKCYTNQQLPYSHYVTLLPDSSGNDSGGNTEPMTSWWCCPGCRMRSHASNGGQRLQLSILKAGQ